MNIKKTKDIGDNELNELEITFNEIASGKNFPEKKNITPSEKDQKKVVLRSFINSALSKISPREERIIRMLFGYGLNNSFKISEISKQFELQLNDGIHQANTAFRKFLIALFAELKK